MVKKIFFVLMLGMSVGIHSQNTATGAIADLIETPQASPSSSMLPGSTCSFPIFVPSLPYSDDSNTLLYGNSVTFSGAGGLCGTPASTYYLSGNDVVYAYTATETGNISITMNPRGETFTGIFVYANCNNVGTVCMAGMGNYNPTLRNLNSIAVTAGQTIYIVLSSALPTGSYEYVLSIQKATCPQPITLAVTNTVSETSATASWANGVGSTATSWEIAVQTAYTEIPSGPGITTTNNTAYEITTTLDGTPLTSRAEYQYWVRADCGDSTFSAWSGPFLFTTSGCPLTDKCDYNFTISMLGSSGGWQGGRLQVIQNGVVITTLGSTLSGTPSGTTRTHAVSLCNGVPFELFWSVLPNYNFNTTMIVKINNTFAQEIFSGSFNNVTHLPLFQTTLYSATVDCVNPQCLRPTGTVNIPTATLTYNSAVINWTSSGFQTTGWGIYLVPAGSPAPNASTIPTYTTSGLPTFTVPAGDLIPDTMYTVYIQSICSINGPSNWTNGRGFRTKELCFKPTALGSFPNSFGATLFWTNPTGTAWQVLVQLASLPEPTADNPNWVSTTTTTYLATGLIPDTAYVFYVKTDCVSIMSNAAGPYAFTTTIACQKPFSSSVSSIGAYGANFGWTSTFTNPAGQVLILPTGTPAPTATATGWIAATNLYTYNGPPLTPETSYDFYVRNDCGSVNGVSQWYGPKTFTTLPSCIQPYNLQSVPAQLTPFSAKITWGNSPTITAWQVLALPAGSATPTATTPGWISTTVRQYTFTSLMPETSYDFYVRGNCGEADGLSQWTGPTTVTTPPSCFKPVNLRVTNLLDPTTVQLDWAEAGSATQWQIMILASGSPAPSIAAAGLSAAFNSYIVSGLIPDTCYDFYARSNCGGINGLSSWSGPYNFCTLPTCLQPINLAVANNAALSVDLSWMEPATATQWEILIQDPGGLIPGANTIGTVLTTTIYNSGAIGVGYHEFYVRSICSESDKSFWSGPSSFYISENQPLCAIIDFTMPTTSPGSIDLCSGENCIDLSATFTDIKDTSSYTVSPLVYNPPFPFDSGTQISVVDDEWSPSIVIPFDFCFYGVNYPTVAIGSNGVITFNPQATNSQCLWNTDVTMPIPNPLFPILNAIYGVYQDINPNLDTAPTLRSINYHVLGVAPCRELIVNYSNIAQFECELAATLQTSQIVLHENSNIIDIYIKDRTSCAIWNEGLGLVGIQNATGNVAHFPSGRNLGTWETHNEAWRFTPDGASNTVFSWLKDGAFYSNSPSVNVCVSENTNMTAHVVYTGCNGVNTTIENDVLLNLVDVTMPTGTANQTLVAGSTIGNIIVTGQNIQWYTAPVDGALLPSSLGLIDGQTYYASQTIGACESQTRLAVTVHLNLSNPVFDTMTLSYNPNPVIDILHIKASTALKEAKVCNILGQVLLRQNFNSDDIALDLSSFPAGTYIVLVTLEDQKKTFKIIKK